MMYHCVLCAESCNTKDALLDHLMGSTHKLKLNSAKLTLFKRILKKSFIPICSDRALAIEEFDYEETPLVRESTGYYLIHSHTYAQKIRKAKISYVSYDSVVGYDPFIQCFICNQKMIVG